MSYRVVINGRAGLPMGGKRKTIEAVLKWAKTVGGVTEFVEYKRSLGAWIVAADGTQVHVCKEVSV
jgi:hypothetical protein